MKVYYFVYCLSFFNFAQCYLDVLLNETSVYELLGVPEHQLYYIRNGKVNQNACKFIIQTSSDQPIIQLSWKSRTKKHVLYDINVEEKLLKYFDNSSLNSNKSLIFSNEDLTHNISGYITDTLSSFVYPLNCSKKANGSIELKMSFYFQYQDASVAAGNSTMVITRLKTCHAEEEINDQTYKEYIPSTTDSGDSTQAFFIAISVFTTSIFLFVFVVAIVHFRSSKKHSLLNSTGAVMYSRDNGSISNQFLKPDILNNQVINRFNRTPNIEFTNIDCMINNLEDDGTLDELQNTLKSITIPKHHLDIEEVLMKGTFSRVFGSTLQDGTKVWIKTVTSLATSMQKKLLIAEASIFFKVPNHQNLLKMEKFMVDTNKLPVIIYPSIIEGKNLKCFLQGVESNFDKVIYGRNRNDYITSQQLLNISIQISTALEHLSSYKVVHQDLAARNCVIYPDGIVMVTDSSLSRDLFPNDYCCLGDNENRPVRWMALESLIYHNYSSQSDVWSFGVLLWELQSGGGIPYIDIDDFEMEASLRDGYRLTRPVSCPEYLYSLMVRCWHYSPNDRPTFSKLKKSLVKFQDELIKYV